MEVHTREGYPFRRIHRPHKDPYLVCEYGEKLGLGSRQYALVDVLPLEQFARVNDLYFGAVNLAQTFRQQTARLMGWPGSFTLTQVRVNSYASRGA